MEKCKLEHNFLFHNFYRQLESILVTMVIDYKYTVTCTKQFLEWSLGMEMYLYEKVYFSTFYIELSCKHSRLDWLVYHWLDFSWKRNDVFSLSIPAILITSATEGRRWTEVINQCFHTCLSVYLSVSWISQQKVVNGLWQNLVDELGMWQEQADSTLVKIRMQIRPSSGM